MSEKTYSISLANGTVIDNLRLNGTIYISDLEVTADIFEGNCSPITISVPTLDVDGNEVVENEIHENMALVSIRKRGSEYWISLRDVSDDELINNRYAAMLRYMVPTITDEDAINCVDLFPVWSGNSKVYSVGERVRYGKQLYKCIQVHTSQATWSPAAAPSLWARVDDPSVEWPEWVQPTGAHDAYAAGAKVSHNGSNWVSDVDNNTWEPGVYGWTIQEG